MPSEKLRILHLIATNCLGGPEKQILNHAVCASSAQQEIWLASFRDFPARPEFLVRAERMGLPTVEFSSGRFRLQTVLELVRTVKKNKFSLLCTHGYKANLLGWAASRLTGCPQIAFARGWTGENWRIKLYERFDRLLLRWTDWVVCVSRPLAVEIGKKRTRRAPPQFIPNCALFRFQDVALPVNRLPFRHALGLPEDAFCICAAGRLSPEKGQRYLLQALPNLVGRIPRLLLILLGEGRERPELERLATELGIPKHVLFAGFKKDIRPWIEACDLLVNPSLTEGTPNVVLEAMALGTPVIATSVGGVPDLVEHLTSGVLVAPGDSSVLAGAIHALFASPDERLLLAQNAQKRLFLYSPERQTQQLKELYSKALEPSHQGLVSSSAALPIQS
jgi:glycosyltransferase involved in cell wall biosynthesis